MESIEQHGFEIEHRIGLLLASVMLTVLVLELVRRRRFKERYALLWVATALGVLVLGMFPRLIEWLAAVGHFQYITVVVIAAFIFLLGLVLSFSVVISRLSEECRELAQEVALLNQRLETMERKNAARAE